MKKKIKVDMTEVEYEEFKRWKSMSSSAFEALTKQQFYDLVKSQLPKDLIESDEAISSRSLEDFVEEFSYCILSGIERPNIEFNIENFDCSNDWSHVYTGWDEKNHWLAFMAGGDWEIPVFGILYSDGMKLKCYIPKNGNCYDNVIMSAWQNEPKHLKGKKPEEMYDLDLMIEDIKNHFNIEDSSEENHET